MREELAHVGARLRGARQERGWTLEDLAGRAGMSASTLSRLESGKRQASLELLLPLTRQLGIRVEDLLPGEPPDPRVRRPVIHREGMTIAPLAPESSPIRAFRITYQPRAEPPRQRVHEGAELLYVISGRLHLHLGERHLVLTRGEAAEFDTRTPHAMWAEGSRPAQVISMFNSEGARVHVHEP
ncbi:helix-turn-helix domain-containing protein [Cellulomonas bogoriensis]|uniref:XRE family transcriptional regulator n=1 Tax=Cellulomonas bogoriensis 69B4 = DSM 16987 TaxID=1386082 RepID=A0A0A0BZ79_9CELL|nr:XRE family transcriptional regulator [Cellulomonas bogoriensis 69B4 = DSM 16987]